MRSILLYFFLSPAVLNAQAGCTDPQAQNYDASALENDGTCEYATTNYVTEIISTLPTEISESSAMVWYNNILITLNDSGGENVIYIMDTLGQLMETCILQNSGNIDWEALAISDSLLYIGDIGNNNGTRQNLSLYSLNLSSLQQGADTISATRMVYKYQDQTNFISQPNATDFDAEAMIYFQDSIHIFSKSWASFYCKHYVLPAFWADTAVAYLRDSVFVNGLITDATVDKETGKVILLGYKLDTPTTGGDFYSCFLHLLYDYPGQQFFKGNNRRIEIGGVLSLGQTEGISWSLFNRGYISSETVASPIQISSKLRSFNFQAFFSQGELGVPDELSPVYQIIKNGDDVLFKTTTENIRLSGLAGEEIPLRKTNEGWHIQNAKSGVYWLCIDNKSISIFIQ